MTVAGLGGEVSMRQVRGRGTPDWNSWAQWVTVSAGLGGFVYNGGGMGRERGWMLEVGEVTRRERTGIGLIGGRESFGE